jgi:hypothetical protein
VDGQPVCALRGGLLEAVLGTDMAGDWIKMRIALADDPAVISIAARLSVDEFEVVGMLHHLWGWADTQSRDGHAPGVTNVWIDRYVRHAGFADAMVSVGWLGIDETGVTFPKFDRHNGETAKTRALAAERKRNQRGKVTAESGQESRNERDKSVTREEKRREEKKEPKSKADARATRLPAEWFPDEDDVSFCQQERPDLDVRSVSAQFRDYWVAKAGRDGAKLDWRATWRNWVRNQRSTAQPHKSWSDKNDEVIAQLTGRSRYEPDDRTIDI